MRTVRQSLAALAVFLLPATVFAQASLTGTVRDASGAVLPGVTVEAASPALIEKTRSAVTDGTGQYRIIDLRPGTYSLTFTLTGFNTVKRENIELAGTQVVDDSRRDEGRRRRRDDHGHRRDAGRRRAERQASGGHEHRRHRDAAGDARGRGAAQRDAGAVRRHQRAGAVADDDVLQGALEPP